MNTKKVALTFVVAIILIVLGFLAFRPASQTTDSHSQPTTTKGLASPDISSPYVSWGGVRHWAYAQQMVNTQGASTTCQILSPAATTTLSSATAYFSALASSSPVQIGYGALVANLVTMSTSTVLTGSMTIPTTGGLVVATTTVNSNIIPPYTYINVKIGGGEFNTPGITTGVCTASFREVQGMF